MLRVLEDLVARHQKGRCVKQECAQACRSPRPNTACSSHNVAWQFQHKYVKDGSRRSCKEATHGKCCSLKKMGLDPRCSRMQENICFLESRLHHPTWICSPTAAGQERQCTLCCGAHARLGKALQNSTVSAVPNCWTCCSCLQHQTICRLRASKEDTARPP